MKKAMVFGAGVSGNGAKKLLEKIGYEVILVDDKKGISSKDGLNMLEDIEIFIKSPGVPYNDLVKKVQELKINLMDEIELAYRYMKDKNMPTKVIGITGTNGKTTTTSKIKELLEFGGFKVAYGGNIGYSYGELLLEKEDLDYVVLELSSYQLENVDKFKADIGMVINLAPDHMDRYEKVDDYYDAKWNICRNQTKEDYFILNTNCQECVKRESKILGKKITLGIEKTRENQDVYSDENCVYWEENKVLENEKLGLRGKHNLENSMFIFTTGKLVGIPEEKIREFLYNTVSLEHRMEKFHTWGEVTFVNDSKGTNIESTKFAVEAYNHPILICGGVDKKLDLTPLIELINKNTDSIYLIGEIGDNIETLLRKSNYNSKKIYNCHTLEKVMEVLKTNIDKDTKKVVLLSPTTASFDQFKSYTERGRIFKELVRKNFN